MKNLPKINPAKAVKASLPYVLAGLLCTKLGEASMSCWQPLQSWGLYFKIRFPASTPLIYWWAW